MPASSIIQEVHYKKDEQHHPYRITTLHLHLESLPDVFDGYCIVQLTDLHFGPVTSAKHLISGIEICNNLSPDLIVLTGDFLQISSVGAYQVLATKINPRFFRWSDYRRKVRNFAEQLGQIIKPLEAPDGLLGVFGNHDYLEGVGSIKRKLGDKITWLVNDALCIKRDTESINIIGVDDTLLGQPNLSQAFAAAERINLNPCSSILLSHNPDVILLKDNDLIHKTDLLLSGHTHGGQIRLPFGRPPITRTKQKRHVCGLSWFEETPIYVSNGLGYGGITLRLFCPPEIVKVVLHKEKN